MSCGTSWMPEKSALSQGHKKLLKQHMFLGRVVKLETLLLQHGCDDCHRVWWGGGGNILLETGPGGGGMGYGIVRGQTRSVKRVDY